MNIDMPYLGTTGNRKIRPNCHLFIPALVGHKVAMVRNNIAQIRKAAGLSQTDLADAIGTTLNNLGKLERGDRRLNQDWLTKIGAALHVKPHELIDDRSDLAPDLPTTLKAEPGAVSLKHVDMSLSMGDGANLDDYFEEGVFEFDAALLGTLSRAPASRLIVGQGIGDSMMPTIHDQSMVIFDTTQTVLNTTDKIWAISMFGAGGIKRLRPIAKDKVLVISDNPTVPDQEIGAEDLRILGRVIWSGRRH
jgi:phage repressor protein C with HTH and peptisase S24 domain